jgi:TonB family protein
MNYHDILAALPVAACAEGLLRRIDALAGALIRRAARNAPASLSQRLQEEWLADMAARRGQITRLRLAVGCWWAARVIMHEHTSTRLAPAGSSAGHQTAAAYASHDSSFPARRAIALLLIASLHAGLVYLLAIGLVHEVVEAPPPVIHARIAPEEQTREPPPPPPATHLTTTGVEISPPEQPVYPPEDSSSIGSPSIDRADDFATSPTPARVFDRVIGGPGKGFPNTADYYPSASRRLGEKGAVSVRVCIDGNGRLTADPTVAQSSGSARLDAGALTLAKVGAGHYRATTEDGRPVPSCFAFRIRFELSD